MKRAAAGICLVVVAFVAGRVARAGESAQARVFTAHYENVLGTSFEMKALATNEEEFAKAETEALAQIDHDAKILSSWDAQSEFGKWFRTQGTPVPVSPELFEVLALFDEWRERTDGALDASAEAVTRAWQRAAAQNRIPQQGELDQAVALVRKQHWKLNATARTATHLDDTPLAMNSFVKSYIIGHSAGAALRVKGVRGVEINIGGDLVVRGDWEDKINIVDPRSDAENAKPIAQVAVRDTAMATSGDYRRGFVVDGQHYSHIVDPRTGEPAEQTISSTVIAPVPATAGALATAFSVMTPEESARLAASIRDVEYLLVEKDGTIIQSQGWAALSTPLMPFATQTMRPSVRLASARTGTRVGPTGNWELTIGIQLALFEQFRVRRPYVAVWIVDQNGKPVRTLALWFDKMRFLHELSEWYGTVLAASPNGGIPLLNTVSSATRPPGSYTFQWDSRDQFGNAVKTGKYTVVIEAAREHGTHQLIRQEIELNGTSQKIDLKGGIEISSAYLDYHSAIH